MLDDDYLSTIQFLATKIAAHESMYIIGRGLNYPIALEAAIKMQEVPYVHAEGFAGGELKHGPIALIEEGTPCIALVANDDVKHEILINALEIKSRGGFIIGISPADNDIFDFWLPVPDIPIASPIFNIIPIQLLSYYTAIEKECDPDKPRNLAKSVTVK
jgi:glucosamine--fructose-6-phosphate aminotransferase (isomerizing)